MTALASTAASHHDVLVAFGTLLFLAGAGLLIGCLLAAAILHGRRPAPLPSESTAVTPEPLHVPQPPVHDITTKPAWRPDGAHHVVASLVERDAPTEYLPRHGGHRWVH